MMWVLVILLVIILFAIHYVDNQDQKEKDSFSCLVFLLIFFSFWMGVCLVEENGIKSDKLIKPSIKVECKDGKCDTTYIYIRGGN